MNLAWKTILHVEDDLGDKELFEHAARSLDSRFNIHWAEDGQVAIDYLSSIGPFSDRQKFPLPNLVLLDLKLPRRNGFEVLQWLREQPQIKWVPVVIFTSSDSEKDIKRAFELGANSLLLKPTAFKDLIECVRELNHYWFTRNRLPSH